MCRASDGAMPRGKARGHTGFSDAGGVRTMRTLLMDLLTQMNRDSFKQSIHPIFSRFRFRGTPNLVARFHPILVALGKQRMDGNYGVVPRCSGATVGNTHGLWPLSAPCRVNGNMRAKSQLPLIKLSIRQTNRSKTNLLEPLVRPVFDEASRIRPLDGGPTHFWPCDAIDQGPPFRLGNTTD